MTAANMFFKCRILSGAAAVVMLGTISAVAAEPGAVSYPRSRALADIGAWIASDTPLSAAQIVDVGPSAVTAVTGSSPSGQTRGFMATIAAESLDPNIAKREHIVSWTIPVEVDCDKRQVRLGDMTGFSARDLKSTPHVVRQCAARGGHALALRPRFQTTLCDGPKERARRRTWEGFTQPAARPSAGRRQ